VVSTKIRKKFECLTICRLYVSQQRFKIEAYRQRTYLFNFPCTSCRNLVKPVPVKKLRRCEWRVCVSSTDALVCFCYLLSLIFFCLNVTCFILNVSCANLACMATSTNYCHYYYKLIFISPPVSTGRKHNLLKLSVRPSVRPSVRSFVRPLPNCEHHFLNKRMNRIYCKLAPVVCLARRWNGSTFVRRSKVIRRSKIKVIRRRS